MFSVSSERPADGPAIEALLDRAFGPDRQRKQSYRYRDGVPPIAGLCLTAHAALDAVAGFARGTLVGTVRCWPVAIGAARHAAVLLGPIAVDPALAGRGIGRALMWTVLDFAAGPAGAAGGPSGGAPLVLLVGDLAYYRRFGFVPAAPHHLTMPGEKPERLLVHALDPAALGTITGDLLPAPAAARQSAA